MSASPHNSQHARRLAVAAAAAILTVATASSAAAANNRVTAVEAGESGGTTVLAIRGSRTPTFTVYKLSRPSRVVIDIANARLAGSLRSADGAVSFDVNSWAVSQVSAHALDGSQSIVRVVVRMARPGSYKVKASGNDVVVRVEPRDDPPEARADAAAKRAAEQAREQAARARAEADKARSQARAAIARAEKQVKAARAAEQAARADAEQARLEAAKAHAAARRARDEMEQARSDAADAKARAIEREKLAAKRVEEAQSRIGDAERKLATARNEKRAAAKAAQAAEQRAEAARAAADRAQRVAAEARGEAARLAKQAEAARAAGKRNAEELAAKAAAAAKAAERERAAAERAEARADARGGEAKTAVAQATEAARAARRVAAQAQKERAEAEARRDQAERLRAEAEAALTEAEARRKRAEKKAAVARRRAADAGSSLDRAAAKAQRAEAEAGKLRAALDEARAEAERLRAQRNHAQRAAERLRGEKAATEARLVRVKKQAARTKAEIKRLELERERTNAEVARLQQERRELIAASKRERARASAAEQRAEEQRRELIAAAEREQERASAAEQRAEEQRRELIAAAEREQERAKAAEQRAAKQRRELIAAAEREQERAKAAEQRAASARAKIERERAKAERASEQAEQARLQAARAHEQAKRESARAAEERAKAAAERAQAAAERAQAERARATAALERAKAAAAEKRAKAAQERAKAAAAEKRAKAAAEKRAVASRAAPKPPARSATIREVDYVDRGKVSRVVINLDGPAKPRVLSAKGRKAILEIPGSGIESQLERTLDTTRYGGPITAVSSYRDPRDPNKVRVVVDLNKPTSSVLKRKGTVYYWDFEKPVRAQAPARRAPAKQPAMPTRPTHKGPSVGASTPITNQTVAQSRRGARKRKIYRGRKIDLDFKDADIHNLLRLLADVGGVNIVIPDEIRATVTVRLRNVPWDQALEVILQSKGLWYRREGSLIRVAPRKILDAEDKAEAERRAALARSEAPEPEVFTLNYAVATQIRGRVAPLLSPKGRIEVDQRTNSLIINDIAAHRRRIIELVSRLDTQTPQIQIEARIVEARTSFRREIGIQWGGAIAATQANGTSTGLIFPSDVTVAGAADDTRTNSTGVAAVPPDFAVNLPAAIGSGSGGGLGFSFGSVGGSVNVNLRLSALEENGSIRIISAPKITTLNNVQAQIAQGVSIPISVVSANGVQTQFVPADLKLSVVPHVSQRDCSIAMELDVAKNEADFANTGARGDPSLLRKEAKTTVLVADGETSVIGGIYTRSTSWSKSKVPFFAELPVIGWLFRNTTETDERTEVLVFITPKITNRAFLRCE